MNLLVCLLIAVATYLTSVTADDKRPAVKIGGKAYVRVDAKNVRDTIKIFSGYWPVLRVEELFTKEFRIISDSSCLLTFDISVPSKHYLTLDKDHTIPIFLVSNDTLIIKVDYREHKSPLNIHYEGLYSHLNKYLYDKPEHIARSLELARLFNNPFQLQTPEKTLWLYKHKSDSMAAVQQAYVQEKAEAYNLPSWFVEYEKAESALSARKNQLLIADYWSMFFQVHVKTPKNYLTSIKTVDITDSNALYSPAYYFYLPAMIASTTEFSRYKDQFLDSCGVSSVPELRGTGAYTKYYLKYFMYVSEKADELLSDDFYHPFMTNHFFHMIRVVDVAEHQKLLDHLKVKLRGTPYLSFALEKYEGLSMHLSKGTPAPGFYLLSADENQYVTLGAFKGKVVLLNFWFPGCKPCIYEVPHEKQLLSKYGDKGFVIINICIEATLKQWQMAIKKFDLKGINVVTQGNWEKKLKEAYGVGAIPHYVLIDQAGNVVENRTYLPSDPRLADLIEATINK